MFSEYIFMFFFPWSLSSSSSTCYLLWWHHLHALPWSMMDTQLIKNQMHGAFDSLWRVLTHRQFKALKKACVSVQNLKSRQLNIVEVPLVKVKNTLAKYFMRQIQQKGLQYPDLITFNSKFLFENIFMGIQINRFHRDILILIKFLNYYLLSLNNILSVVRRIFKKWINISQGCCHLFVSKNKIKEGEKN